MLKILEFSLQESYPNTISISSVALLKADFQSAEYSERAEILLFAGEKVALKLNR